MLVLTKVRRKRQLHEAAAERGDRVAHPAMGVADQGLSSLTNFATTLLAARIASPSRFGDLALGLSIAYMATILARGLTSEPLMTIRPRLDRSEVSTAESDAIAMTVLVGLIAGTGMAALTLVPTGATRDFGWIGLCMPAVLVQDGLRYVGFSRRRPDMALASDAAWSVVQFGMLAVLIALHSETLHWIVLSWGAGAAAGVLVGGYLSGIRTLGSSKRWFETSRSYSLWLLPQLGLSQATDQGSTFVFFAVFGTAVLGGVRAMQVFIRPVFAFMLAVQALLVPHLTLRLLQQGRRGLLLETRRLAALVGAVAAVVMTFVFVARRPLTAHVFGPAYLHYADFLVPLTVGAVLHACSVVPNAGLRAMQCGRRILMVQVVASTVSIATVLTAAMLSTAYVTCWSIASQGLAAVIANWVALGSAKGVRGQQEPEPPDARAWAFASQRSGRAGAARTD